MLSRISDRTVSNRTGGLHALTCTMNKPDQNKDPFEDGVRTNVIATSNSYSRYHCEPGVGLLHSEGAIGLATCLSYSPPTMSCRGPPLDQKMSKPFNSANSLTTVPAHRPTTTLSPALRSTPTRTPLPRTTVFALCPLRWNFVHGEVFFGSAPRVKRVPLALKTRRTTPRGNRRVVLLNRDITKFS